MPPRAARSRRPARDRVALATWPSATAARIGARFRLDADAMAAAHPGVAPVAVVGWSVARALRAHPDVNRRVVLFGVRPNATVRISFAVDAGDDLQAAVVDRADELSPRELQRAVVRAARVARDGGGSIRRATRVLGAFPVAVSRPGLRAWSVLTAGLGLRVAGLGAAPFGAALVSSVATFDLPAVDPPFVPFARCPLVLSVGAAHRAPVVRDDAVVVGTIVEVSVTADHRVCDGAQFAGFAHDVVAGCVLPPAA